VLVLVLLLVQALELELELAVDSSLSNSSQMQVQAGVERCLSTPQPVAAATQTAHIANVAAEKTTQQISKLAPNQEIHANSLTTYALSHQQCSHPHPHHYCQKTTTPSHCSNQSFPLLHCQSLSLLSVAHHHHQQSP
jgi:hypothetical protein